MAYVFHLFIFLTCVTLPAGARIVLFTLVFLWRSYEGDFFNGRMHGVGVYRWPHGDVYRGSWKADRRSGRGRYEWTELGLTFEGMFNDDRRMGRGSIIFPDSSRCGIGRGGEGVRRGVWPSSGN